jgi:hypothetical protein
LDDPTSPAYPGSATVRFVNLTQEATPFDLWVDRSVVSGFAGVSALASSQYVPMDRYPHRFEAYPTGSYTAVTGVVERRLNPGSGYSVFLMGVLSGNPGGLRLVITRDR